MLTTQLDFTQADLKEKLKHSQTDYLIIDSPEGLLFVHKKNATVFVIPHEK